MAVIILKNSQICSQDFQTAIRSLADKKLPPEIYWIVADILEYSQRRAKKYAEAFKVLMLNHGGKEKAPGQYDFPTITGDREKLFKDIEALDAIEGKIETPLLTLPPGIEIEPIIVKELKPFMVVRLDSLKELE